MIDPLTPEAAGTTQREEAGVSENLTGRELDARVALVMGKPFRNPTHGSCCTCQVCGYPFDECQCGYSEDIGMAWRVVERMRERGWAPTLMWYELGHDWLCQYSDATSTVAERADTAAHAICLAALQAVDSTEGA